MTCSKQKLQPCRAVVTWVELHQRRPNSPKPLTDTYCISPERSTLQRLNGDFDCRLAPSVWRVCPSKVFLSKELKGLLSSPAGLSGCWPSPAIVATHPQGCEVVVEASKDTVPDRWSFVRVCLASARVSSLPTISGETVISTGAVSHLGTFKYGGYRRLKACGR